MNIPANLILLWAGTVASIPTNWTRETTLDGKYPKAWGDAVTPNTTGGASTHTHTSPAHTHSMQAHTHTYTLSSVNQTGTSTRTKNVGGDVLRDSHSHGTSTSGSVSGGTTASTAITYGAVSNDPPYHAVIFIKASAGAILQNDIIALWNGWGGNGATPSNWQYCNGSNSSPDLRNKYVKGAGTGENAGATGGSITNTHDISHSHTATNHSHVSAPSVTRTGGNTSDGGGLVVNAVHINHTHTVTLADTSVAPQAYSGSLVTAETVEPAHIKLGAIQKKTNGIKERGIIGLWLGDIEDIPAGWVLCDGDNDTPDLRDKFIKIATDSGEFEDVGGANSHTHASQSHSHTGTSHTHTGTASAHVAGQNDNPDGSGINAPTPAQYPTHTVQSVSSQTANWDGANTTADSSANEPEYRTVAYVQFQIPTDGGAFLENFM